jgi:4,5-DOPA dioxygenase extradiol
MTRPAPFHFELGQKLKALREEGVLIVGSGNTVHNLRRIDWDTNAKPFGWAIEFDQWVKGRLDSHDAKALTMDYLSTEAGRLAVPSPDHYYPLLYAMGAADPSDPVTHVYDGIQNGSIAMRCVRFG